MTPAQRTVALRLAATPPINRGNFWGIEAVALLRELAQEPQAEPVAWMMDVRAIVAQAALALEELDGPGYLIGGVMHHRIGLILPKLSAAIDTLAHPPQRKPLTDEQIAAAMLAVDDPLLWGRLNGDAAIVRQFARAIEAAHGITEDK